MAIVLMYHRIADHEIDRFNLCTPLRRFREQLRLLREWGVAMPLEELAANAAAGTLPPRAFAITLDDGYYDAFDAAALLGEVGVPATFFINSARLAEEREGWWDRLARVFLQCEPLPEALERSGRLLPTRTPAERSDALATVHDEILRLSAPARDELVKDLERWSGHVLSPRPSHRLLTEREVRQLAALEGVSIGAHGVEHLWLPSLSAEAQRREIGESRRALQSLLARPVRAYAYAYGAFDERSVEEARRCDFAAAVTVAEEVVPAEVDVLRLPRLTAPPLDQDRFAAWLAAPAPLD
jgi:peptidoglycan/xylan/chitin deacetylase (PgdA/CDA1 family)